MFVHHIFFTFSSLALNLLDIFSTLIYLSDQIDRLPNIFISQHTLHLGLCQDFSALLIDKVLLTLKMMVSFILIIVLISKLLKLPRLLSCAPMGTHYSCDSLITFVCKLRCSKLHGIFMASVLYLVIFIINE